ncbi:bestrophin-like domain [Kribbella sp. NBC_00359]|uniref:bestrophin-like domain n=1 Tax=Kribbella sp. NBC_00359 TaxID=2975966 RepID=UPI002E1F4E58
MLRTLLNAVPITVLMVAAVCLTVAVMALAVWVVRRTVPATRDGFHAEISAPMLGIVAAVFGLLLAFVIIIAYQNFLEADDNASREAAALSSIVRDSAAFPEPGGSNVRRAVGAYVRSVVEDEFPQMREGTDSDVAKGTLDGVFAAFRTVEPRTPEQTAFYDDAVRQLNETLDARRNRIESAVGGLPWDIAVLILFSSFVVVAYSLVVGSPSFWFHLLGPAAIASVVAVSLVVLVDLSYPFSGDFAIPPDDFRTGVLKAFFN